MKKILLILILLSIFPFIVNAAMDPTPPFCEHQGYIYESNPKTQEQFCIFDDGNKCDAWEFFLGECGSEYVREFPCRKEGEFVWGHFEECCEGTEAYSKPFTTGQSRCLKVSTSQKISDQIKYNYQIRFYAIIIISLIIVGFIILWWIKKRK